MDNRDDPAIHNMSIFTQKRGYGELSSVGVACSVGTEPAAKKSKNYEDEVATIFTDASSYQKAVTHTEYMECDHSDGLSSIGDYTHSDNRHNNSASSSFSSKSSSKKVGKLQHEVAPIFQ